MYVQSVYVKSSHFSIMHSLTFLIIKDCDEWFYYFKIFSAFRICTNFRAVITNEVCRRLKSKFGRFCLRALDF